MIAFPVASPAKTDADPKRTRGRKKRITPATHAGPRDCATLRIAKGKAERRVHISPEAGALGFSTRSAGVSSIDKLSLPPSGTSIVLR